MKQKLAKFYLPIFMLSHLLVAGPSFAVMVNLPDFAPLVEKTSPAVVSIITFNDDEKTEKLVPDDLREELENTPLMDVLKGMFGNQLEEKLYGKNSPGLGSGSIVSPDGYIITNYHVIKGAKLIFVQLKNRDEYSAQLIGFDEGTDLALLKIDAQDMPYIEFAQEAVNVGQWVVAIGAPFGFEDTLTVGVVSAKRRSLGTEKYVPFIQTDVAINPGNSGGPLLNLEGQMVGINAQIVSESGSYAGLSFAVPANLIENVMAQLKTQGFVERGWLGLAFQDLSRDLASSFGMRSPKGALVSKVLDSSPADKAGLQTGDIIISMNEKDIRNATDVPPLVGLLPIGSKVIMDIIRLKQKKKLTLIIERAPTVSSKVNFISALDSQLYSHGGIRVRDIDFSQDDNLEASLKGVIVIKIESLPWRTSGLRKGDVIMRLNEVPVTTSKEFYRVLAELPKNKHASLLITRQGQVQRYIAVKIPN